MFFIKLNRVEIIPNIQNFVRFIYNIEITILEDLEAFLIYNKKIDIEINLQSWLEAFLI